MSGVDARAGVLLAMSRLSGAGPARLGWCAAQPPDALWRDVVAGRPLRAPWSDRALASSWATEAQRLDPTILAVANPVSVDTTYAALAQQYFYFAKIAARSGQLDASIEFLRRAQAAGFQGFGKVRSDPDFKTVVPDRRFAAIAR